MGRIDFCSHKWNRPLLCGNKDIFRILAMIGTSELHCNIPIGSSKLLRTYYYTHSMQKNNMSEMLSHYNHAISFDYVEKLFAFYSTGMSRMACKSQTFLQMTCHFKQCVVVFSSPFSLYQQNGISLWHGTYNGTANKSKSLSDAIPFGRVTQFEVNVVHDMVKQCAGRLIVVVVITLP